MNLLLIEDDLEISDMLKNFLLSEQFQITTAYDGQQAWDIFQQHLNQLNLHTHADSQPFDLILLDLMLPKLNGLELLQRIRKQSAIPIIIFSAKDSDSDITLGLGLGADDYITKPFSVSQTLARIKACLRRAGQYNSALATATGSYSSETPSPSSALLTCGELLMNLNEYSVSKNGVTLELTAKEFEILKILLQHPKRVYTKEQLYSLVWNEAYLGDENAVNVHISRLRNKIEDNPRSPKYIITVWGIGYKLGGMS